MVEAADGKGLQSRRSSRYVFGFIVIPSQVGNALISLTRSAGQAVVEFTLVFLLLLVVAWIPVDFGLAFYTSQLAQNASREGARIAAADRKLGAERFKERPDNQLYHAFLLTETYLAKPRQGFLPLFFQAPRSPYSIWIPMWVTKLQPQGDGHGSRDV